MCKPRALGTGDWGLGTGHIMFSEAVVTLCTANCWALAGECLGAMVGMYVRAGAMLGLTTSVYWSASGPAPRRDN